MTKSASEEEEEGGQQQEETEEPGLTLERLAKINRISNELKQVVEEWDDDMTRSLRFGNTIDGAMSIHTGILANMKKQRQQLPITMFLTQKTSSATPASSVDESDPVEEVEDPAPPDEEQ